MGSLNLFQAMDKYDCRKIIFSSSANVYDQYTKAPFKESNPIKPSSKYGLTKVMIEKFLRMYSERYNKKWSVVILRYFPDKIDFTENSEKNEFEFEDDDGFYDD